MLSCNSSYLKCFVCVSLSPSHSVSVCDKSLSNKVISVFSEIIQNKGQTCKDVFTTIAIIMLEWVAMSWYFYPA